MTEAVLRVSHLVKSFPITTGSVSVLHDLDLVVAADEMVAVVGSSGVGKTTLLHLLGGLDRPDSGTLHCKELDLLTASLPELAAYRNTQIGFVFQFHHLLPEFTALENVEMPFRISGKGNSRRDHAREILVRLGLEHRLDHRPAELSGGELQRVAIARAVVTAPALVLADEPTGNLDPATGARVFALLTELQQERGFALVLATHNERLAQACDRVLRLESGGLIQLDEQQAHDYFNRFE
jgi:lipoprotein-releasing system ATP-binding protein